ncbi:MAG: DUF1232 domain-containing protein [Burkholderiaceae bacterium]|nr:DUF1232 domain-containing protein [Burkholderiaceae bacterium]
MTLLNTLRHWARRLKRDVLTLWFAARHAGTPWQAKALAALVVAYAFSPIDLIPDFVPVLGLLDDLLLLPGLIWLAVRLLPPPVLDSCRLQAEQWLAQRSSRPRSPWMRGLGLAMVLALWLLLAWLVWRAWP